MENDRIELKISVPKTKPNANWTGWDLETFELREHLFDLIDSYGIEILKQEITECETLTYHILYNKWKKTGFLDGLDNVMGITLAFKLESAAIIMLNKKIEPITYIFKHEYLKNYHCSIGHTFNYNDNFIFLLIVKLARKYNFRVNENTISELINDFEIWLKQKLEDNNTGKYNLEHFSSIDMEAELLQEFIELKFGTINKND